MPHIFESPLKGYEDAAHYFAKHLRFYDRKNYYTQIIANAPITEVESQKPVTVYNPISEFFLNFKYFVGNITEGTRPIDFDSSLAHCIVRTSNRPNTDIHRDIDFFERETKGFCELRFTCAIAPIYDNSPPYAAGTIYYDNMANNYIMAESGKYLRTRKNGETPVARSGHEHAYDDLSPVQAPNGVVSAFIRDEIHSAPPGDCPRVFMEATVGYELTNEELDISAYGLLMRK